MLDKLTSKDFKPYLNQIFYIHSESETPLAVELIEVTELGDEPGPDDEHHRQAFSILFRGSKDDYLPQHIYQLRHEKMAALDVFLVPIGPDKEGMRYEATFT
jgi:hypothetical protein